jgi:hypothetical protein
MPRARQSDAGLAVSRPPEDDAVRRQSLHPSRDGARNTSRAFRCLAGIKRCTGMSQVKQSTER